LPNIKVYIKIAHILNLKIHGPRGLMAKGFSHKYLIREVHDFVKKKKKCTGRDYGTNLEQKGA